MFYFLIYFLFKSHFEQVSSQNVDDIGWNKFVKIYIPLKIIFRVTPFELKHGSSDILFILLLFLLYLHTFVDYGSVLINYLF